MVHVLYSTCWSSGPAGPRYCTCFASSSKRKTKLLHFLKKDRAAAATPFWNATKKKGSGLLWRRAPTDLDRAKLPVPVCARYRPAPAAPPFFFFPRRPHANLPHPEGKKRGPLSVSVCTGRCTGTHRRPSSRALDRREPLGGESSIKPCTELPPTVPQFPGSAAAPAGRAGPTPGRRRATRARPPRSPGRGARPRASA